MSNTKTMQHLEDDMSLMFEELDSLRDEGSMNMFGGPIWLQDNYYLTRVEAIYVFNQWTERWVK